MPVYLLATLDTKGPEAAFLRDRLVELNVETRIVDTGCLGEPAVRPDVSSADIFAAAGTSLQAVRNDSDRGTAVTSAAEGARVLIRELHDHRRVDGVIALGGSAGTTIGTAAMRELPLGVPKVMISTLASGQTRPYVGGKDILMMNAVVDIAGINRISRVVLAGAARALAGMVTLKGPPDTQKDRRLIAATMFGVTTPCVQQARRVLEDAGFEVLIFHATGNGGEAMEGLIADGLIAGVLDITTTELADERVGGILSAGPDRLTAAGKRGIPQVISVGATDMVNFGPKETVPEKFSDRLFYHHNPTVTLMRTTEVECTAIGRDIRDKLSQASGPTCLILPLRGVSAIDGVGQPFENITARQALFDEVRRTEGAEVIEMDNHINEPEFAEAAAKKLLELMHSKTQA